MFTYELYYKNGVFQIVRVEEYTSFVVETFVGTYEEALKRYEAQLVNISAYWNSYGIKLS